MLLVEVVMRKQYFCPPRKNRPLFFAFSSAHSSLKSALAAPKGPQAKRRASAKLLLRLIKARKGRQQETLVSFIDLSVHIGRARERERTWKQQQLRRLMSSSPPNLPELCPFSSSSSSSFSISPEDFKGRHRQRRP